MTTAVMTSPAWLELRRVVRFGDTDAAGVVHLNPQRLDPSSFEIQHRFQLGDQDVARGCIRHVAISTETRRRCALPDTIERWLEAAQIGRISEL